MTERLDKLLSDSGLYSRSEARALVRAGRVSVDGAAITAPERKFSRECDIRVDGERLNCAKYRYFLLDKPEGYVCATEDSRLPTVLELLPEEFHGLGLFPVGTETTPTRSYRRALRSKSALLRRRRPRSRPRMRQPSQKV